MAHERDLIASHSERGDILGVQCPNAPIAIITTIATVPERSGLRSLDRRLNLEEPAADNSGLLVFSMDLDFSKLDGLITAVIQDHQSGRVLMVGFMNPGR